MADAGVRRHGLEVREGALAPAEEGVALPVAAELERRVPLDREPGREVVDLDGVVDHELDRDQRVDLLRVAAEVGHRGAHRGQVDDGRHAGEVLQEDAGGVVVDLLRRLRGGVPAGDRLDVARGDGDAVLAPQHVLEQDAQRVRQPRHVVARLERVEPEHLELPAADGEGGAGAEGVGMGHASIVGARDFASVTSDGAAPRRVRRTPVSTARSSSGSEPRCDRLARSRARRRRRTSRGGDRGRCRRAAIASKRARRPAGGSRGSSRRRRRRRLRRTASGSIAQRPRRAQTSMLRSSKSPWTRTAGGGSCLEPLAARSRAQREPLRRRAAVRLGVGRSGGATISLRGPAQPGGRRRRGAGRSSSATRRGLEVVLHGRPGAIALEQDRAELADRPPRGARGAGPASPGAQGRDLVAASVPGPASLRTASAVARVAPAGRRRAARRGSSGPSSRCQRRGSSPRARAAGREPGACLLADDPRHRRAEAGSTTSPTASSATALQLVDPALGQRRALRVEVPGDRRAVRLGDAGRVRGEALVAQRLQILAVGIEHVLAADVAGGVEERDPDAGRHLEQAAPLAHGLGAEPVEERGHLLRRGQAARVGAQIGERALEGGDLERRDVDQAGGRPGAAFERREELVDRLAAAPPRPARPRPSARARRRRGTPGCRA